MTPELLLIYGKLFFAERKMLFWLKEKKLTGIKLENLLSMFEMVKEARAVPLQLF